MREGCGDAEVCGAVVVRVPEYEPHAQSYAVMLRVPDGSDVFLRRLEAEPCSIPWARRSELIHKVEIGLSRRTAELGLAVAGLEVQGQAGFDATGFRTAPTPRSVAKAQHLWERHKGTCAGGSCRKDPGGGPMHAGWQFTAACVQRQQAALGHPPRARPLLPTWRYRRCRPAPRRLA